MDIIRPLSSELAKIARDELNEDPAKIPEYINTLREWILTQPHLNSAMDSQFLLAFLRKGKYSMERAKMKIDQFYTVRTALPEFFTNINIYDPEMQELIRLGTSIKLPQTIPANNQRIFLSRPGAFDPNKYDIKKIARVVSLFSDVDIRTDDNIIISGFRILVDCSNMKPTHFLQYEPLFLKKMQKYYQDCLNIRVKGIHLINLPRGGEPLINLVKSFLSDKNKSRFFTYGSNLDSLYEQIPKYLLPKEYGGETSTIPEILESMITDVKQHHSFLQQDELCGVDETKRLNFENGNTNLFGAEGSFRTLDID